MKKKIAILEAIWLKSGYEVINTQANGRNLNVHDIEVTFKRIDGSAVDFVTEWSTLKSLAQRQGLYILPIKEQYNSDVASSKVLLIDRKLVYGLGNQLIDLMHELRNNYWYVNEDQAIIHLVDSLIKYSYVLREVQTGAKRLVSNPNSYIVQQFSDNEAVDKWITYKGNIRETYHALKSSGQFDEAELQAFRDTVLINL